jgi:hypothetical protein
MEKLPAPHEKLTDKEIKDTIEVLLRNNLFMKNKKSEFNYDNLLCDFLDTQENIIFKLRSHFSPELTTILRITLGELTDMMKEKTDG